MSGAAAPIVRAVPLSEANYIVAWKALHQCYDYKQTLIIHHLDMIIHVSTINSETLSSLQELANIFLENIAAIQIFEVPDLSGVLLFYMASRILSTTTKRLFEAENQRYQGIDY